MRANAPAAETAPAALNVIDLSIKRAGPAAVATVDETVRALFAVIVKHSGASYMQDALQPDGTPNASLLSAHASAQRIKRWIVAQAQGLLDSGLAAAGYRVFIVDEPCFAGRDAASVLIENKTKWPAVLLFR